MKITIEFDVPGLKELTLPKARALVRGLYLHTAIPTGRIFAKWENPYVQCPGCDGVFIKRKDGQPTRHAGCD